MMMKLYLVCKKIDGEWSLRGISTEEVSAKLSQSSGEFLIIPIQSNTNYNQDLISESMPGAILWSPTTTGIEAALNAMSEEINTLRQQAISRFDTLDARITNLEQI